MNAVTVHKRGRKFVSEFSQLPGKRFGPWDFPEMVRDLTISALPTPMDARNLVMDAAVSGSATAQVAR